VTPSGADIIRSLRAAVMVGLRAAATGGHVDYLTAQAYAAGLVAMRCVEEAGTLQDAASRRSPGQFHVVVPAIHTSE
jgi:hypothetical protein